MPTKLDSPGSLGLARKIRNPKHEIRNKSNHQMAKIQNQLQGGVWSIWILCFGFVSSFGFRYSDFLGKAGSLFPLSVCFDFFTVPTSRLYECTRGGQHVLSFLPRRPHSGKFNQI